ncbi:MAG: hypothetical protein MSC31_12980 [Solirubrobacteraceae bacterium MAG38_C4-C5]|nr:hypothetical protein [Candidatus Siliceabacter maunaloa]
MQQGGRSGGPGGDTKLPQAPSEVLGVQRGVEPQAGKQPVRAIVSCGGGQARPLELELDDELAKRLGQFEWLDAQAEADGPGVVIDVSDRQSSRVIG